MSATKHSSNKLILIISIIDLLLIGLSMALTTQYLAPLQLKLAKWLPNSLLGYFSFVLLLIPALSIGLPRQFAALTAGFLFDVYVGVFIATLAASIACLTTLLIARTCLSQRVHQHYPKPLAKVKVFFAKETFIKALIIRLLPAGSNFLTNVLAGTAQAPIKPYLLGSTLGFIPQMLIFTLIGSGLKINNQQQLYVGIVLLAIALLLSFKLYRKSKIIDDFQQ